MVSTSQLSNILFFFLIFYPEMIIFLRVCHCVMRSIFSGKLQCELYIRVCFFYLRVKSRQINPIFEKYKSRLQRKDHFRKGKVELQNIDVQKKTWTGNAMVPLDNGAYAGRGGNSSSSSSFSSVDLFTSIICWSKKQKIRDNT